MELGGDLLIHSPSHLASIDLETRETTFVLFPQNSTKLQYHGPFLLSCVIEKS